ncbi:MAG: hypothetical protein ABI222_04035, partial [Opitutaceae bacterium]
MAISLSLRGASLGGTTKQSSWLATARFAHLAMTRGRAQAIGIRAYFQTSDSATVILRLAKD